MTYKDVSKDRLRYLLNEAISFSELNTFLEKNKSALIAAHVKNHNSLMGNRSKTLDLLTSKMSEKASAVFESWFRRVFSSDPHMEVNELVKKYRDAETTDIAIPVDEVRPLARATLSLLLKPECPTLLLEFLRTPIAYPAANQVPAAPIVANAEEPSPATALNNRMLTALSLSYVGTLDKEDLQELSLDEVSFINGLAALREGNIEQLRVWTSSLAENSVLRSNLEEATSKYLEDLANKQSDYKGLKAIRPTPLDSGDSLAVTDTDILGFCQSAVAGSRAYIQVIAALRDGTYFTLDEATSKQWLPTDGRIIAFADNRNLLRFPQMNEVGVWRAEEYPTDKPIRFRVVRATRPVFEIADIPFLSSKYDAVRADIKRFRPTSPNKFLFRLEDGLIVRLKKELNENSDDAFDEPLDAWRSLDVFNYSGRRFAIGPLPNPDSTYMCAGVDRLLRGLLKASSTIDSSKRLSKGQIQELMDAIAATRANIDGNRLRTVQSEIEGYLSTSDRLDAIRDSVFQHPRLVQEIESAKTAAVAAHIAQKSDLQREIERLREEKRTTEEALKAKRQEENRIPAQLAKAIREAFERSTQEGTKKLAEVAVISAIQSLNNEPREGNSPLAQLPNLSGGQKLESVFVNRTDGQSIESILLGSISSRRAAPAIEAAIRIATECGMLVLFSGIAASYVAKNVASVLCDKRVRLCAIPVGLIGSHLARTELENNGRDWDGIVLQNMNHSLVEEYAANLLELVTERILGKTSVELKVFGVHSDSVASLPYGASVQRLVFRIDLDRVEHAPSQEDVHAFEQRWVEQTRSLTPEIRPWPPVVDRLLERVRALPKEIVPSVLPLIEAGLKVENTK